MSAALAAGRDVALWPGGEVDSLRPWTKRDEAVLAGRTGFIKLAIASGVPIVPIATVGGPDSMPVLFSGRRLAKALQLDKIARLKVFPFAIAAPWGIAPAALPEIPLPTKIRTAFQEPVKFAKDPSKAKDDDYVERKYEEVQKSIQRGIDELARRRRFPVFG
jgi:1-acyl-sn-glycerol-3-phosphate acyltransferase